MWWHQGEPKLILRSSHTWPREGTSDRGNHADAVPLTGHEGARDTTGTTPPTGLTGSPGPATGIRSSLSFDSSGKKKTQERKGGEKGRRLKKKQGKLRLTHQTSPKCLPLPANN